MKSRDVKYLAHGGTATWPKPRRRIHREGGREGGREKGRKGWREGRKGHLGTSKRPKKRGGANNSLLHTARREASFMALVRKAENVLRAEVGGSQCEDSLGKG
jgi:hypothetical protein